MNELALREQKLYRLRCELEKRKKMMIKKGTLLKNNVDENNFLNIILDDYQKYYKHIVDTKKKQLEEFNKLRSYLMATKSNIKSIDINIDRAKLDYRDINNEIIKLKNELDEIISNNNINKDEQ